MSQRCGRLPPAGVAGGLALVVQVDVGAALLEGPHGAWRAPWGGALLAAMGIDPLARPCPGDRVAWRRWPDGCLTCEAVRPRATVLAWPDAGVGGWPIPHAANADIVAIVGGAGPAVDIARLVGTVLAPGVPVLRVSCRTGVGLPALVRALADGACIALVGAPGTGKSRLARALAGGGDRLVTPMHRGGCRTSAAGSGVAYRVGPGMIIDTPSISATSMGARRSLRG